MEIKKANGSVSFEGMTEFESQIILRCVKAIGYNLKNTNFESYQVFSVDDKIQELGFSDDEMHVICNVIKQLPELEMRPLFDPNRVITDYEERIKRLWADDQERIYFKKEHGSGILAVGYIEKAPNENGDIVIAEEYSAKENDYFIKSTYEELLSGEEVIDLLTENNSYICRISKKSFDNVTAAYEEVQKKIEPYGMDFCVVDDVDCYPDDKAQEQTEEVLKGIIYDAYRLIEKVS